MSTSRAIASAVALVLAATVGGCGRSAGPSASNTDSTPATTNAATVPAAEQPPLTDPGRAARDYALAARSWTAETYRAQYRKQLKLSTGSLRRSLKQVPPTDGQIAQYRADGASLRVDVVSVRTRRESASEAQYTIELVERSVATGQTTVQRTVNLVELQHRGTEWKVSGFTIVP